MIADLDLVIARNIHGGSPWLKAQHSRSKYGNCRRDRKLSHSRVASWPIVRHHLVGIEGAHCGLVGGGGELMEWGRILAYISGTGAARLIAILAGENPANRGV